MPNFSITSRLSRQVAKVTKERGITMSAVIREALAGCDALPPAPTMVQHSVRLDRADSAKLAKLAKRAKVSTSRALALLLESAVERHDINPYAHGTRKPEPARKPEPEPEPGPRAYHQWADLLLECAQGAARRAPGDSKAWIGSVLDRVVERVQPADPALLRARVRARLPELNRRDLIALHRCDLPSEFPREMVESSEIRAHNATWHFIELR